MMETLLAKLLDIFSVGYMFCVIVASYLVIKGIDYLNGDRKVPTWAKRVVTFACGVLFFWVFREFTEETFESLITSFFAALFVYDGAIKYILKKLNADYKKC